MTLSLVARGALVLPDRVGHVVKPGPVVAVAVDVVGRGRGGRRGSRRLEYE